MLDLGNKGRGVLLAMLLGGCGTASDPAAVAPGSAGNEGTTTGAAGGAGGAAGGVVSTGTGGAAGVGGGAPAITSKVLPPLPGMSNVNVIAGDHHVTVTFDPVDAAKDYRIYSIPADGDVLIDPTSGKLTGVKNATYRCAGTHEAADIAKDGNLDPHYNNCEEFAIVDSSKPYMAHCGAGNDCFPTAGGSGNHFGQGGYARQPSETQLGYVYTTPAPGRAAVHAFGDSNRAAYYECSHHGWATSRAKKYSTDPAEWDKLRAMGWLDLGVQFYVPMAADAATTQQLYMTNLPATAPGTQKSYYFLSGAEYDFRKKAAQTVTSAFSTLKAAPSPNVDGSPGALPLYRVLYSLGFASSQHDELAVGKARFDNLYGQGQGQQNFQITYSWSGDAPQNLVLEALDEGCPFQGNIGEKSIAATDLFKQWFKLDEIRAASANGEVFLNGHGETSASRPNPIARAYVTGVSAPLPKMDFQSHYESTPEVFSPVANGACGAANFNCDAGTLHGLSSANFDITFNGIDGERWSAFNMLGQLWTAYSDSGADTAGQVRMTAKPAATMSADTYLHASMDVTTMSSARRYPQIIISDQVDAPAWISTRQGTGKFIVLQPINDWPTDLQVQVCANRPWAVNDQCPHFDMFHVTSDALPPVLEMGERASEDGLNRFEIYASTSRAYVFFDGQPYGCAKFDPAMIPSGNVKVTFGDVVYHTGVDNEFVEVLSKGFHNKQKLTFGERHFGSLGFSSKVAAPMWDEAKMPCATTMK